MGKVTVIIPNFNRAFLVGETIECILRQTLTPKEIIVVDDGSTDDSCKVIRSFGNRVQLIQQQNQGPGAARNAGLAVATGEFIQFMDSDDLTSLNKLEVQFAALRDTGADFAYCPWVRVKISGKQMQFSGPVLQGGPLPEWKPMLEWRMGSWCLILQNCLFRRSILQKSGWFRLDLMPTEDSEYLVRILLAGARPVFTSNCLVFYRTHEGDQITASGTTARQRAEDQSRYYEKVGNLVANRLESFHQSTRIEIALNVYRHQLYCGENGWRLPVSSCPLYKLVSSISKVRLLYEDYLDRLTRKVYGLSPETPNCCGLILRSPSKADFQLAADLGFSVVSRKE